MLHLDVLLHDPNLVFIQGTASMLGAGAHAMTLTDPARCRVAFLPSQRIALTKILWALQPAVYRICLDHAINQLSNSHSPRMWFVPALRYCPVLPIYR